MNFSHLWHRKEKKWHIWTMNLESTITLVTYILSRTQNPILAHTLLEYFLTTRNDC
jgi:hypothetical protein